MEVERIVFTALRTVNYDSTVPFYRDIIGVPLEEKDHGDEGSHNELSWHGPYFHFAIFRAQDDEERTGAELSFNSKNVRAVHARAIAAGITVTQEPQERPWGLSATYRDPDGNSVGVTELSK